MQNEMIKNKMLTAMVLAGILSAGFGVVSAAEAPTAGSTMREIKETKLNMPIQHKPEVEITDKEKVSWPIDDQVKIKVNGFRLNGQDVLSQAQVDNLLKDKIGKELTFKELREAANTITKYLQDKDYMVAKVYLPAQRIGKGIVNLTAVVGKYDQILVQNDSKIDDDQIKKQIVRLKPGNYIKRSEIERGVWLISDLAAADSKVTIAPGSKPGTSNVTFVVHKHKGPVGSVFVDNYGNRYTGRNELGVNYNWLNPAHEGDTLAISGLTTGSGKNNGDLTYYIPFDEDGNQLEIGYSHLHYILGNEYDASDSYGTSDTVHAAWRYAIRRSSRNNQYVRLGFEWSKLEDNKNGELYSDKKDTGMTLSLFGDEIDRKGYSSYDFTYKWGSLGLDNDYAADLDASGPQTSGSFHKLSTRLLRQQTLNPRSYILLSLRGQLANKNLDSYEKLELGGAYGVRAYPQGEASGDVGYVASAEYRYLIPIKGHPDQSLQLAAFVDGGSIWANKDVYYDSTNVRHLYGYGIGALWGRTDDWLLRVSYGWKLGYESYQSTPDSNGMLWLQAVKYF